MNKFIFIYLFLFPLLSFSQHFKYKKKVNKIQNSWYEILLDKDIYKHTSSNLSDLRILGVNAKGDTIEAPYILKNYTNEKSTKDISCDPYNLVNTSEGYYATFSVPNKQFIASCKFHFTNTNYDWIVTLEGSNDEKKWYTVTKNQRFINIVNEKIDFNYSELQFEPTNYMFYRIIVKSPNTQPKLETIKVTTTLPIQPKKSIFTIKPTFKTIEKAKTTYIEIKLPSPVPVESLSLDFIENEFFYRPATIYYGKIDTSIIENNLIENFENQLSVILSSTEKQEINIGNSITDRLMICIENDDNMPLEIENITINALHYKLVTRITKSANYALYYGDNTLEVPNYDIIQFKESIPTNLETLKLSNEEIIATKSTSESNIPTSKIWLWLLMLGLIGIMFFFSIKLLKK